MSKSKKNGVDPSEQVQEYGAEAVRFALMFSAPYIMDVDWDDDTVKHASQHLDRIKQQAVFIGSGTGGETDPQLMNEIKILNAKVISSYGGKDGLNAMMGMSLGVWRKAYKAARCGRFDVAQQAAKAVGQALWPIVPRSMEHSMRLIDPTWCAQPVCASAAQTPTIFQINGVRRGEIVGTFDSKEQVMEWIKTHQLQWIEDHFPQGVDKVVWVPNRVINVVPKKVLAPKM